jgi:nucleoside-diphosphate-sugar epimerase
MNLVTGASGFIGGRLLAKGERGLVRRNDGRPGLVTGDLQDKESLLRACQDVECVFHCAGYAHAFTSSDPDAHWRINYQGTCNLLDAAAEAGVRRFVFLSSAKAIAEPGDECATETFPGLPETAYGKSKREAEHAVLEAASRHGMHAVILRPAMVYGHGGKGNLERMARGIRAGWFPPLPETGNRRSIVHVDDLIDAMRLVVARHEASGKTYIVADCRPYSGRELYDEIRKCLQMPRLSWHVPAALLHAGGCCGDFAGKLLGRTLPMNAEVVERLLGSAWYSPSLIESELGWKSRISLPLGLREMLEGNCAGNNRDIQDLK